MLKEAIDGYVDGSSNAKKFMALISKYQDFDNLTNAMANELIEKIVVHERDRKGSMQSPQRVDIYFSFIGTFVPPAEPVDPEVAAALEAERLAIELGRTVCIRIICVEKPMVLSVNMKNVISRSELPDSRN